MTELHGAAKTGNVDEALQLLEQNHVCVNSRNMYGWTPLHYAAIYSYDVATALIHHGADVNAQDKTLWTPLHRASKSGGAQMVQLLLEYNANINAEAAGAGDTPLHIASYYGNVAAIEVLLEQGKANADVTRTDRKTPLDLAFDGNEQGSVACLLLNGAHFNAYKPGKIRNRSPLHRASAWGNVEILQRLLDQGPSDSIWLRYNDPSTAQSGEPKRVLLCVDDDGDIPLHLASCTRIAKCLVEHKGAKGLKGDSSCHWVCRAMLLTKNAFGQSPLEMARVALKRQHHSDDAKEKVTYLATYRDLPLAVSTPSTVNGQKRKRGMIETGVSVKLNPEFNDFQQSIAESTLVLLELVVTSCIAHAIMGFLSLEDVMERRKSGILH